MQSPICGLNAVATRPLRAIQILRRPHGNRTAVVVIAPGPEREVRIGLKLFEGNMSSRTRNEPESAFDHYAKQNPNPSSKQIKNFVAGLNDDAKTSSDESVRRSERRPVPKRKADTPVSEISRHSSVHNEQSESEDEQEEERSESMEHSSDNEDYTPTASERAKRRKKSTKNYNERHMMLQQVQQSTPAKRKRGRPRTVLSAGPGRPPKCQKPNETPSTIKEALNLVKTPEKENEISIYEKYGSKDFGESVPGEDVRQFVAVLDGLDEVKNASGGFQRFVRTMPDLCCVKLSEYVDQNYDRAAFPAQNDMLQVAQFLRHVWNKLSADVRKKWEQNARKFLRKEKGKNIIMPPSDFPFTSEGGRCNREVEDCCTSEKKDWKRFADVQMHFVSRHKQIIFYACNYCGHLFPTANALTKHCEKDNQCPEFQALLLDLALKSASVEMSHCSFYLTCSDCALWLPISDVNHSEKAPSFGWYFLMKLLEYHSPCSLMIVSIYSVKPIEKHEQLDKLPLLLTYTPNLVREFPMCCEECSIDFSNVAEANSHFKDTHPDNIINCPFTECSESFGTESHFRLHMQRHLHSNAYLADYIRNRAAVYPPFSVGGIVSMGLTDSPLVGGMIADSSIEIYQPKVLYHRKLDDDEIGEVLIDQKLKNSQENSLTLLVDSDGDEANPEGRIDMGVEHLIDYKEHASRTQFEARAKLNTLFSKQATQRLDASCIVNDPEVLLTTLGAAENCDKLNKKAQKFHLNMKVDSFVDSMLELATMEARLPTWACSLALDGYLLNRNYWICSACNSVICHTDDLESHGCDKEEISELFCVSESPNTRLHCQICDETVCSLVGLREHYIGKHTTWLTFIDSAVDKGESLTDMTRKSMEMSTPKKAIRTDISDFAQKTDKAFGLAPVGCFPKKKVVAPVVSQVIHTPSTYSGVPRRPLRPVEQIRPPKPVQALPVRQLERPVMRSNRPVVSLAPLNQKMRTNPQRISPFDDIQTTEGQMVRCKLCPMGVRAISVSEMKKHLQEEHSFPCNGCGQHFAHQKNADFHNCCSKLFKDVPHSALVGKCSSCAKSFAMSDLIKHVFNDHTATITYGSITGKWYPAFIEISVSEIYMTSVPEHELAKKNTNFVYARTRVDPALISHFPVYKPPTYRQKGGAPNPLDFRSMASLKEVANSFLCYLCGIDCSSKKDLEDHYSLHSETFTACPLCSVRIVSHDAMSEHLRAKHYREVFDRSSDKMKLMCNYCSRKVNMVDVGHVLFECPRPPICGLCEDYSTDNPSTMGQHYLKEHREQVHRFRCSACTQKYYSMFVFATHTCNPEMAPHKCDCGDVFPDRQTFSRHFMNKHIEPVELQCNLCDYNSGRLLPNAIGHRTAHYRLTITQAQRRCIVLDRKLYKKAEDVTLKGKALPPLKPKPTPVLSEEDDIEILEVQKAKTVIISKPNNNISISPDAKPTRPVISDGDFIKHLVGDLISVIEDAERSDEMDWDKLEYGGISTFDTDSQAGISSRPGSADLIATVRTEDDEIAGTSSCVAQFHYDPTGDGDDEVECIQVAQTSTHPEALITAVDDDGDEELQVLATVQNPPGTLSSSLSSRSAKFKCCQCSATFLTKSAVESHTVTQHQSDAGGILDEAYGMPVSEKPVFICRCCCVAFETVVQQQEHMIRHRSSKALSCKECSAFAYNYALEKNHKDAHQKPISYCCSECRIQFKKESRLYCHLQKHHDIPLLFFCKECGMGSQDIDVIHRHLQISRKCEKALTSMNFDVRQHGYGICPASLLHYQPVDVKIYTADVAAKVLPVIRPSDCTHRSFLAPTSSLICCRECFCLKNMQQFLAEQAVGFGSDTPFYSKSVDERLDCPFAPGIMRPNYRTGEVQSIQPYRYSIPVSAVRELAHEQWKNPQPNLYTQRNNRPATSQPILPQMLNRILPRNAGISAAVYGIQKPGSPRLIPTAMPKQMQNGGLNYTLRQPTGEQPPRLQLFQSRQRQTGSHVPPMRMTLTGNYPLNGMSSSRDVITIDEDAPAARAIARRNQTIYTNKQLPMDRYNDAKKDKPFFCVDCLTGFDSEKHAIEHMYIRHCNVANSGNRSVVFSLECPFKCTSSRYSTITAYRQHLATAHSKNAKYRSLYCAVSFVDENSCNNHCKAHEKYEEENGMVPPCCELCGDVDNWTDKVGPVNISHMAIHGCDLNLACRDCDFAPGPTCPNQLDVLLAHFIKRHTINVSHDGSYCRICNGRGTLNKEEMMEHFKSFHMMTIFRPVLASIGDRSSGEIKLPLLKTNSATQKFLGLPVEKEWKIDEIVENDLHVFRVICKGERPL